MTPPSALADGSVVTDPVVARRAAFAFAAVILVDGTPDAERVVPAVTPTATAKPTRAERLARYYRSTPEEALAKVDRHLEAPVAVPADLPEGTGAHAELSNIRGERRAYIGFRQPDGGFFQIQYGTAGCDGCGPLKEPVPVDINGARGLAYENRGNATVLWPVREGELEGSYGIYGRMRAEQALALARSMDVTGGNARDR